MRELRTTAGIVESGISRHKIAWAVKTGRWTLIIRGVYGRGPEPPSKLDIGRATAYVTGGIAAGYLSAALHNFDGVKVRGPEVIVPRACSARRAGLRRPLEIPTDTVVVGQVKCLSPAATLHELAARLDDDHWEQALEFCLRKKYVTREELIGSQQPKTVAASRIRRVIVARGGLDTPPTESLLETLAVQLIRRDPTLPTPIRQFTIYDEYGNFVGRPDLWWPELGIFLELDGQQHEFQPVYDARRQTRITIATGWRCGRLTWDEVNFFPESTLRELAALLRVADALPTKVT